MRLAADWQFVMAVNICGIIHGIRHFVAGDPEARRRRPCRQHRFGRRFPEPPRHRSSAILDEQAMPPSPRPKKLEHELGGTNVGVSVLLPRPHQHQYRPRARNRPDHMGGPQIRPGDQGDHGKASPPRRGSIRSGSAASAWSTLRSASRRSTLLSAYAGRRGSGRGHQGLPPPHRGGAEQLLGDALTEVYDIGRAHLIIVKAQRPIGIDLDPTTIRPKNIGARIWRVEDPRLPDSLARVLCG